MTSSGLIEEIERQIDATRHALDRTIRALQFQLSPRHQIHQVWRAGANWATANPAAIALGSLVLVATATALTLATRRRR